MKRIAGHTVIRSLGRGSTGRVELVEVQGRQRALKVLHGADRGPRDTAAFRDEFLRLREMLHPNLVRVHDIGVTDRGEIWFTSEYVEGSSIDEAATRLGREELISVVAQFLRALEFIHRRGWVHFDVQPHNLFVTEEGHAKLLDFGLASRPGERAPALRGTWPYVAPEVLQGGYVDRRADLFSFGVVIASLFGLGQATPPHPFRLRPGDVERLPPEFRAVVPRLLEHAAARRYEHARDAIRDLANATGTSIPDETIETLRAHVSVAPFIGREAETTRWTDIVSALRGHGEDDRPPRLLVLHGEAGVGKSRFLLEWGHAMAAHGAVVIRARCRESTEGPYEPLLELVSELLAALPERAGDLLVLHGPVLAEVAPEIVGPDDGSAAPAEGRRARVAAGFSAFLADATRSIQTDADEERLEPERRPLILAIEDLHLAEDFVVSLLDSVTRDFHRDRYDAPPLLVVATLRDDSSKATALVERLRGRPHASVDPLGRFTRRDVATLLTAMMGAVPPDRLVDQLHQRTGGNAFFLQELLRSMVDAGAVTVADGLWRVTESGAKEIPASVRALLQERLADVSSDERDLLRTIAVFGEEVPGELLRVLAPEGESNGSTNGALDRLLRRRIVRESPGDVYGFLHALTADVVLSGMSADERARRHEAAGRLLLASGEADRFGAIAHHFSLGADRELGFRYCVRAAGRLRRRGADDRAAEYLERALHLLRGRSRAALRARLFAAMGDVDRARGRLRRAVRCYEVALEAEASKSVVASRLRRLGEVLAAQGDDRNALERCRESLRLLGPNRTRERARLLGLLGRIYKRRGDHRRAIGSVRRGLKVLPDHPVAEGAMLMSLLGNVYQETGDHERAASFHEKGLRICRELNHRAGAAQCLHNLGLVQASVGDPFRSTRYYREALRHLEEIGHLPGIALTLNNLANVLAETGELREAETFHRRARSIRERIGDAFGEAMSIGNLGSLDRRRGRWGRAYVEFRRAIAAFGRLGAVYGETLFLANLAELLLDVGDLERATDRAERALDLAQRNGLRRLEAQVQLVLSERDRIQGEFARARERAADSFETAQRLSYKEGVVEADLQTARLWADEGRTELADPHLERALRAAQERQEKGLLASCWLVSGIVGTLDGSADRLARARDDLERALRHGRTAGPIREVLRAAGWLVRARRASGEEAGEIVGIGRETVAEVAGSLPRRLRHVFLADPRRAQWDELAETPGSDGSADGDEDMDSDDLIRLLEVNKRLNSETDLHRLVEYIMETAVELTGAERGFLILVEGNRVAFQVTRNFNREEIDEPERKISRSIVSRVVRTGQPILTDNASEDERLDKYVSVSDLKLKSILSIPFRVKNTILGALYLDNRIRRGAFTHDHVELASALSDQAAIAIENLKRQEVVKGLNLKLQQELEEQTEELAAARLAIDERPYRYDYDDIIGQSRPMKQIFLLLDKVIESDVPVLIQGESGTGKELIARAIHKNSKRSEKGGEFVTVNCGAIPENLLESEFFGHVRGAFTGAVETKKGLFVQADGGTLFLDEIGDMDFEMQKKLLRVLQEGEVRPVGGKALANVDVRIICATNKDLKTEMKAGNFREDLYYRINVINIQMPPLRDRREDVAELVEHFLARAAREIGIAPKSLDEDARARLASYSWPGNVRELENEIKRALALSDDPITVEDLSPQIQEARDEPTAGAADDDADDDGGTLKEKHEQWEREQIVRALEAAGGNQTRAAKELGISRVWLRKKMERYGLLS